MSKAANESTLSPEVVQALILQRLRGDLLLGIRQLPTPPARTGRSDAAPQAVVADKAAALRDIDEQEVRACEKCVLARGRARTVFGQGNAEARLVFVGEGPGREEDLQGLAFVGRAGQLLTKMINAMSLTRDDVYICNVVKCRPPQNRTPAADEMLACSPYLWRQLQIIEPEVIVALGAPASKTLLGTAESIGHLRGRFHDCFLSGRRGEGHSVPLMPTYHPSYLLRASESESLPIRRKVWSDLQLVMDLLGLRCPGS